MRRRVWVRAVRDEGGVAATTFLLLFFALLAVALLAIDGGSLYVSQRGQVADTDAAALAVAKTLLDDPCTSQVEIDAEADEYIDLNDPTLGTGLAQPVEVTRLGSGVCPPSGTVRVRTTRDADLFFGPVFGYDEVDTGITSVVAFGQLNVLYGLRPIALCSADPHYSDEWQPYYQYLHYGGGFDDLDYAAARASTDVHYTQEAGFVAHPTERAPLTKHGSPTPYRADSIVHRVAFERLFGSMARRDCGDDGPGGNFGYVDFDGGSPNTPELLDRITNGYEGGVSLGEPVDGDEDCNTVNDVDDENCTGNEGFTNPAEAAMQALACPPAVPTDDCDVIYIVVYNDFVDVGESKNRLDLFSFAGIVLRDFRNGAGGKAGYMDVEFVDELTSGDVGVATPGSTAPFGMYLCGTDTFENC